MSNKSWLIYHCVRSGDTARIQDVCEIKQGDPFGSAYQDILILLQGLNQEWMEVALGELSGLRQNLLPEGSPPPKKIGKLRRKRTGMSTS